MASVTHSRRHAGDFGRSKKRAPKYTHVDGNRNEGRESYLIEKERKRSFMEISRHDYSNTVIKEETLFFKLSG